MTRESKSFAIILHAIAGTLIWSIALFFLTFTDWTAEFFSKGVFNDFFSLHKPDPTGGYEEFWCRPYFRVLLLATIDVLIRLITTYGIKGYVQFGKIYLYIIMIILAYISTSALSSLTIQQGLDRDYSFIYLFFVFSVVFFFKITGLMSINRIKNFK